MSDEQQKPESKPKNGIDARIVQGRSPAYPFTTLSRAIERADQVRAAGASRGEYPPETFYKLWELGAQSSGARQTMAALNHFGLVEYIGRGDTRKVKLSDLALKIVLDKQPNSRERAEAIKTAALTPEVHRSLYDKYGALLPADVVLQTFLSRDLGFNEEAAKSLIDNYRATLSLAGLGKPVEMSEAEQAEEGKPVRKEAEVNVGSYVQWTSNGADQFPSPKKVVGKSDDGQWLWVEGSPTGIPVSEVTTVKVDSPLVPPPMPAHILAAMAIQKSPPGTREEKFALKEGDVVLNYPETLSAESIEDLEGYLQVFFKKAKRAAAQKKDEAAN